MVVSRWSWWPRGRGRASAANDTVPVQPARGRRVGRRRPAAYACTIRSAYPGLATAVTVTAAPVGSCAAAPSTPPPAPGHATAQPPVGTPPPPVLHAMATEVVLW